MKHDIDESQYEYTALTLLENWRTGQFERVAIRTLEQQGWIYFSRESEEIGERHEDYGGTNITMYMFYRPLDT